MFYIKEFIISTTAAVGFGLIFDLPKKLYIFQVLLLVLVG